MKNIYSAALLLLATFSTDALAATLEVCLSGCTYDTLGAAVGAANASAGSDLIEIEPGTYSESDIEITEDLEIEQVGVGVVTIQANTVSGDYLFQITGDTTVTISRMILDGKDTVGLFDFAGAALNLDYVTIQNGRASTGAGITAAGAAHDGTLTLTDVEFLNNYSDSSVTANAGGAILVTDATVSIEDTTFTSNEAIRRGGAIVGLNSDISILDSTFTTNDACRGGAIFVDAGGTLDISTTDFDSNTVSDKCNADSELDFVEGGAISIANVDVDIYASDFDSNTSSWYGGAISTDDSGLTLTDSTFNLNATTEVWDTNGPNNYSWEFGGGALFLFYSGKDTHASYAASYAPFEITGSTFTNNTSATGGGAIIVDWSEGSITDSDFSSNTVSTGSSTGEEAGGAVWILGSTVTFTDSTFTSNANLHGHGGALFIDTYRDQEGGGASSEDADVTITSCEFDLNTAEELGGAIRIHQTSAITSTNVSITDSSFTSNAAAGDGGGAISLDRGTLTLNGSDLTTNSSRYGGALHCANSGTCNLQASLFCQNTATHEDGGAVYSEDADLNAFGNVFFENKAEADGSKDGGAIALESFDDSTTDDAMIGNNHFVGNLGNGGAIWGNHQNEDLNIEWYNNLIIYHHGNGNNDHAVAMKDNFSNTLNNDLNFDHNAYYANNFEHLEYTNSGPSNLVGTDSLQNDTDFSDLEGGYVAGDCTVQNLVPKSTSPLLDAGRGGVGDDIGAFGGTYVNPFYDADGDGSVFRDDCDDDDPARFPENPEVCSDNIDNDCDGLIDNADPSVTDATLYYNDGDEDGYGDNSNTATQCDDPAYYFSLVGGDCDDGDPNNFPGNDEVCDGSDNDCDGDVDDADTDIPTDATDYYVDADLDGDGDEDDTTPDALCTDPGAGYSTTFTDCDDDDINNFTGNTEVCDTQDNDCDTLVDDYDGDLDPTAGANPGSTYYDDIDLDSYGDPSTGQQACTQPTDSVTDNTDCDDDDVDEFPGQSWYPDSDGDTYGDETAAATEQCERPADYVLDNTDCNDSDPAQNPDTIWYDDQDGDTYGDAQVSVGCAQPTDSSYTNGDCNDNDDTVYPTATDICDGQINDCDESIMLDYEADIDTDNYVECPIDAGGWDGAASNVGGADCDDTNPAINPGTIWYLDDDGDTFGANNDTGTQSCTAPSEDHVLIQGDCNDGDAVIYNSAVDICDLIDNNCDGDIDEDATKQTWHWDSDGDGYGDSTSTYLGCQYTSALVDDDQDCDDTNGLINPDALEVCTPPGGAVQDENCDGDFDEAGASDGVAYYPDADGDNQGDANLSAEVLCEQPPNYTTNNTDCDDNDITSFTGGTEFCDGKDNDCANGVDDGLPFVDYYPDGDGDNFGEEGSTADNLCADPGAGYATTNDDCDDADTDIFPGNPEVCDGKDNDCANGVDDGLTFVTYYIDVDKDDHGDENDDGVSWCEDMGPGFATIDDDCDDEEPTIYTGAPELCDGLDNDCNDDIDDNVDYLDFYEDSDGDGYGNSLSVQNDCAQPTGYVLNAEDCDDNDNAVNPDAEEVCNDSVDNDCDNYTDDSSAVDAQTWYDDNDGDGAGDPSISEIACVNPGGSVTEGTDCDDNDIANYPANTEICDGGDNDCDSLVDDADDSLDLSSATAYYDDADDDTYGDAATEQYTCTQPAGTVTDSADCDDSATDANSDSIPDGYISNPAALEICDGVDNDCDDEIDEGMATKMWYLDNDGDGAGNAADSIRDCLEPPGYVLDATDCDDEESNAYPSNDETCDGIDNDCDGDIDEEGAVDGVTYYTDLDGDDYGDTALSVLACQAPSDTSINGGDCDDTDSTVNPAATEICDTIDNDCDGLVDDDDSDVESSSASTWYTDADGDSYGDTITAVDSCDPDTDQVATDGDCDDDDANIYPGAAELCDTLDNDCDGDTDEEVNDVNWYVDADEDGYGDDSIAPVFDCAPPTGPQSYVQKDGDCDDTEPAVNPNAYEACDGIDNDCNGIIDTDSPDLLTFYQDDDSDGYGQTTSSVEACSAPPGYARADGDCDDTTKDTHPGADEICDSADNDCDGDIDEDAIDAYEYFQDKDGDSYGDSSVSVLDCAPPNGYVADSDDCDDYSDTVYPGAPELCDGVDNDCDGNVELQSEVNYVDWYVDVDDDGFGDGTLPPVNDCTRPDDGNYSKKPGDCDDTDEDVNPNADEIWYDGVDQDCDGASDFDQDGDGYTIIDAPDGSADDCNDEDPEVFTGAALPENDCESTDIPIDSQRDDLDDDSAVPGRGGDLSPFDLGLATDTYGCACATGKPSPASGLGLALLLLAAARRRSSGVPVPR